MKYETSIPLRWADQDPYGHVNNVQIMRLFEEVRVRAFWTIEGETNDSELAVFDASSESGTQMFMGSQRIEYVAPIAYRSAPIFVRMWISKLGGASVNVCYEMCASAEPGAQQYVKSEATLVLVSTATGKPRRMTETEREAWSRYLEEPFSFREA